MNYNDRKHSHHVILLTALALCLLLSLFAGGCRKKSTHENLQEDNNVAGFLFHFDQRAETVNLVKFKNKNQLPVSVSWYYPEKKEQEETEKSVEEDVVISTDPSMIIDVYNALNNVIIVGSGNNVNTDVEYFISFTLPDESTCTYEFISENTIRLSDHNYTIESDGKLWKMLKENSPVT